MIPKIERDFVAADLAAVEALLAQMTDEDVLTSLSLEARRDELRETLATLEAKPEDTRASAALFFSGRPVVGSRGIEIEFGAEVVHKFQDVVTKVFAHRQTGSLGQRGTVPGKDLAKLHITNIVHGSFGFRLEELTPQADLIGTPLKEAVDQASRLIDAFGEADDEHFVAAVEDLDDRVLGTIREFYELIRKNEAAFRLVSGEFDKSFDRPAVERAAERARITTLKEETIAFDGQLAGALPDNRQFEYRTSTDRGTILGKIDPNLEGADIGYLNRDWADQDSRATVHVKQVIRGDRVARQTYVLLKIEPRPE